MKSIESWFDEYGESHQNPTNKLVHWLCVPSIFFSIIGLLYTVKLTLSGVSFHLATPVILLASIFYIRLSWKLAVGTIGFAFFCHLVARYLYENYFPLVEISLIVFIVAWIGQFWGHKIEGKKPSFLKDLQFLLIGPAWLMHFIYEGIGVDYK